MPRLLHHISVRYQDVGTSRVLNARPIGGAVKIRYPPTELLF